jgi:CubicO group peptidase (beta-lactamase class C family)
MALGSALAIGLGIPVAGRAQTPVASPISERSTAINALFADQTVAIPFTGSVLITEQGTSLLDAAFGFADGLARTSNAIDTGFQIASITKTFTAALIMQLRDDGAFALDDPASAILPRFAGQLDSGSDRVTIEQLLNHTSGVPDFLEIYDPFDIENYPDTLDDLLDRIATEPLRSDPGQRFLYSNSGYLYLGRIIEAITGQSFETALADRITAPLDLQQTWLTPGDNRGPLATGYLALQGLVLPVSRFGRPDLAEAAGGLTSTTHDLHAWLDTFVAGEVVATATVTEMMQPGDANYGLGWEIYGEPGDQWIGHFGQTIGFRSAMFRQPDREQTIIILSNRQDYQIEDTVNHLKALLADS